MFVSTRTSDFSALREPSLSSESHEETPFVDRIADRVSLELVSMQTLLGDHADAKAFFALDRWARSALSGIARLVDEGTIFPQTSTTLPFGRKDRSLSRPLRLGVFPIAANPLHWLHVLGGLAAIEQLRLDKVVYLVAGADSRKPTLAAEQVRHLMAKEVLGFFCPLLEYSAISRGSAAHGEENVFRLIASSRAKAVHAFYIAGSDHYRRCVPPSGAPDTIHKLETGIRRRAHGFNPRNHTLSAVFLDRAEHIEHVETSLDIRWISGLPLDTSSTRIRNALVGKRALSELSFLPYSAYSAICANGIYSMSLGGLGREDYLCKGVDIL